MVVSQRQVVHLSHGRRTTCRGETEFVPYYLFTLWSIFHHNAKPLHVGASIGLDI